LRLLPKVGGAPAREREKKERGSAKKKKREKSKAASAKKRKFELLPSFAAQD
jgi:hypothetical protein